MPSTSAPDKTRPLDAPRRNVHARPVIRALFFDAAGTLIDTAEPVGHVYARMLTTRERPLDPEGMERRFRDAFRAVAPPDFDAAPDGDTAERRWWREVVERAAGGPLGDPSFDALFEHYATPEAWSLLPGVPEALADARDAGFRLAVVSNFDRRLHAILRGLGIDEYFEHITSSADARARKPSPAIFHHALDAMNLTPEAVLHVGDSARLDGEGARRAGIRAYLLNPPERDLAGFPAWARNPERK